MSKGVATVSQPIANSVGIILAAGASRRLGTNKAMIEIGMSTLLELQISMLQRAGLSLIIVVSNPMNQLTHGPIQGVKHVVNSHFDKGRMSSIQAGLNHALSIKKEVNCVIICPVDRPGWRPKIIGQLLEHSVSSRPVSKTGGGHPVTIMRNDFDLILTSSPDKPLNECIEFNPVHVDSPFFNVNLDTQESVDQFLRELPRFLSYIEEE